MLCYAFVHLFRSLEHGPYWKLFWLRHFLFCQFQYLYIPVCYCIWFIDKMFGGPVILWRIEILGFVPAWEPSQNSAAANTCSGICIIYLICFTFWYPTLKLFFFQRYDGRRKKIYNSELYDDVLKFGVITILTWEGKLSKNLWELAEFELACSLDCWSAALEVFSLLDWQPLLGQEIAFS